MRKVIKKTCIPYQQAVNQLHEIDIRSEYDIKTQGPSYPDPKAYKKFLLENTRNHMQEKFRLLSDNGFLLTEDDLRYN